MYISRHVSWLFFAIECPSRCIIMYFKCWKMLFLKEEVVAIVNVFMYWRRHSFEFWECCVIGFFFVCLFMFNVTTYRALDIYFWPTSETRGHIFQKSLVALELRAHRHALSENRINSFSRAAERETETGKLDVMQLWPRVSQLNKPYLMKTWCATAFNNGCNTTTVCLLVCRRPHKKSILLKYKKKKKRLHIKRKRKKSTSYLHFCHEPTDV